jgi:hypothetical protein
MDISGSEQAWNAGFHEDWARASVHIAANRLERSRSGPTNAATNGDYFVPPPCVSYRGRRSHCLLTNLQILNHQTRVHHDVWRNGVEAPHVDPGIACPEGEE